MMNKSLYWRNLRFLSAQNKVFSMNSKNCFQFNKFPQKMFAGKTKAAQKEKDEARKEKIREKFQDTDLQQLMQDWHDNFDFCIEEFEDDLQELKSYRASPTMFNDVPVMAYGDVYDLSELAQTIVRGENNLLVSVYDETIKDAVMKALIIYDNELECSMEGKYVSVKMGMTRAENRDVIVMKAKRMFIKFKQEIGKERAQALRIMKQLEAVIPMDDVEIQNKELEELYQKTQQKGKDILDRKVVDIQRK